MRMSCEFGDPNDRMEGRTSGRRIDPRQQRRRLRLGILEGPA